MTDTCRITAPAAGDPVFNPDTGQYDSPEPVTVYEGKCRIPPRGTTSTATARAGEQSFEVGEYPFDLPLSATDVAPGQTVTYLTAPHNPDLVGRMFGIVDPVYQSQPVRRRFKIKTAVG